MSEQDLSSCRNAFLPAAFLGLPGLFLPASWHPPVWRLPVAFLSSSCRLPARRFRESPLYLPASFPPGFPVFSIPVCVSSCHLPRGCVWSLLAVSSVISACPLAWPPTAFPASLCQRASEHCSGWVSAGFPGSKKASYRSLPAFLPFFLPASLPGLFRLPLRLPFQASSRSAFGHASVNLPIFSLKNYVEKARDMSPILRPPPTKWCAVDACGVLI